MASPAVGFTPPPFTLDWETALSLGLAFSLMPLAQGLTASVLPASTPRKYYYLFMWHAYGQCCSPCRLEQILKQSFRVNHPALSSMLISAFVRLLDPFPDRRQFPLSLFLLVHRNPVYRLGAFIFE